MIERIPKLTVRDFRQRYLQPERPVIIQEAIEDWPARRLWSPEYFRSHFGDVPLEVERLDDDRGGDAAYFLRHVRRHATTVGEYLDLVLSTSSGGRFYAAMQPLAEVLPGLRADVGILPYYSEVLRRLAGQKAFLWMGPAGCVAALHFDPLHNFCVQVFGSKKWTIFPKDQRDLLYLPSALPSSHFSPIDVEAPQLDRFPKFKESAPLEFVLEAGEVLFLPRGWAHHVRAVDFSISLNFWWITLHWRDLARVIKNRLMRR